MEKRVRLSQDTETGFLSGTTKNAVLYSPVAVKPYSVEKNKSYYQTRENNWEKSSLDFQVLHSIYVFLLVKTIFHLQHKERAGTKQTPKQPVPHTGYNF